MGIIYFFIGWTVGLFVLSFTVLPVFIILFFGLPATRTLKRLKLLKENNDISRNYFISLIILPCLFALVSVVVFSFFPSTTGGYIFGGGMALLFGLGKFGKNQDNIVDYVQSNKKYFSVDAERVISAIIYKKDVDSGQSNEMTPEQQARLNKTMENMRVNPQHAQAMADGSIETLNKITKEE
jgi:hypothetical protein